MLKYFASCLKKIELFLGNKGVHYSELKEDQCLQKLHFMVDVTTYLNQDCKLEEILHFRFLKKMFLFKEK